MPTNNILTQQEETVAESAGAPVTKEQEIVNNLQNLTISKENSATEEAKSFKEEKKENEEEEEDLPYPNNRNFIKSLRPEDKLFFDKALPHLKQISGDIVHVHVSKVFNWDEMAQLLGKEVEGEWYMVAFYSTRKVEYNKKQLNEEDNYIQQVAKQSGGLLKHWSGEANKDRESLTVNIWVDREHALNGIRRQPFHQKVSGSASKLYFDSYTLNRYKLIKRANETVFHFETY
ncbi:hypothetical protein INT45_013923 [Circinella minor]|uniref:Uncharacterized protein n=1 Tax=Circinella minor TaxID=1195481 RepID=A0A8H7VJI3_9FUNG|nr:hypothetical protein INT45_013923 [Circinella minor]